MEENCGNLSSIVIDKNTLVTKLTENLNKHVEEYTEAVENFKVVVTDTIGRVISGLQGFDVELSMETSMHGLVKEVYGLNKPTSHEHDYKLAIAKAQYDIHENMKLSETEFRNFVLDDWEWKSGFTTMISGYALSASSIKGNSISCGTISSSVG
jgi:hypothetical protein